jgi:CBS domain-containing protein
MQNRGASGATTELPVRSQVVLAEAASPTVRLRVFCPAHERSVPYETCAQCGSLRSLPPDPEWPGATIKCTPEALHAPTQGSETRVGAIVSARVVCVRPELPLRELRSAFTTSTIAQLAVVDEGGRLLGTVWREDFIRHDSSPVSLRGSRLPTLVGGRMESAVGLHEAARVTDAIRAIARDRARIVFAVDDERVVVGALTDLDLLRWLASERRSLGL